MEAATTSASFLSEQRRRKTVNVVRCFAFQVRQRVLQDHFALILDRNVVNTFTTILVVSNWQAARTSPSESSLHSQVMSEQ